MSFPFFSNRHTLNNIPLAIWSLNLEYSPFNYNDTNSQWTLLRILQNDIERNETGFDRSGSWSFNKGTRQNEGKLVCSHV